MKVWRSLEEVPRGMPYPVVTIGNFDGVHLGHRRIIEIVRERAEREAGTSIVLTFDPHPGRVLAPHREFKLVTPTPSKLELFEKLGLDAAVVLPFTEAFSHLAPEEFVRHVLVKAIGAREVVVGDNFRFGYKHAGNVHLLEQLGRQMGFQADDVPPVKIRGGVVSSSRIRELLRQGNVALAGRLLGRCFSIRGRIVSGHRIGRSRTVPTLNLEPYAEMLPRDGVYITETACDGGPRAVSVTNVGQSPTFHLHELRVESFLLEGAPPPHASRMEVFFWARLRDELEFASAEALKAQILDDAARTRRFFRLLRREKGKATGAQRHRELSD